jgi:hypothetical protein
MVKKRVKSSPNKKTEKKDKYDKLNMMLIENFINIQKALVNSTEKLEDLSLQISKLLQLFELSAKSFVGKVDEKVSEMEKDREFLTKLNALLEQNKLIAKGLTLMEENIRDRVSSYNPPIQNQQPQQRFSTQYSRPQAPQSYPNFDSSMQQDKNKLQTKI